jgi:putative transposase
MPLANRSLRSIRLQGYDYSQDGAYFITICTFNKELIFGEVKRGDMNLTGLGRIAEEEWNNTAVKRNHVKLDEFVVMPNHFHGIVWINTKRRGMARHAPALQEFGKPLAGSLSSIIGTPWVGS